MNLCTTYEIFVNAEDLLIGSSSLWIKIVLLNRTSEIRLQGKSFSQLTLMEKTKLRYTYDSSLI